MLVYVKTRLNYPKNNYEVIVTDSVGTDGTYIVEAYRPKQAIGRCKDNIIYNALNHITELNLMLNL